MYVGDLIQQVSRSLYSHDFLEQHTERTSMEKEYISR
jgi:hypothetical protein